jgi:hypothetical protein
VPAAVATAVPPTGIRVRRQRRQPTTRLHAGGDVVEPGTRHAVRLPLQPE